MKTYRITEISGWFRVRANDKNNTEMGCGNSVDEAVTDAMHRMQRKMKREKSELKEFFKKIGNQELAMENEAGTFTLPIKEWFKLSKGK